MEYLCRIKSTEERQVAQSVTVLRVTSPLDVKRLYGKYLVSPQPLCTLRAEASNGGTGS